MRPPPRCTQSQMWVSEVQLVVSQSTAGPRCVLARPSIPRGRGTRGTRSVAPGLPAISKRFPTTLAVRGWGLMPARGCESRRMAPVCGEPLFCGRGSGCVSSYPGSQRAPQLLTVVATTTRTLPARLHAISGRAQAPYLCSPVFCAGQGVQRTWQRELHWHHSQQQAGARPVAERAEPVAERSCG